MGKRTKKELFVRMTKDRKFQAIPTEGGAVLLASTDKAILKCITRSKCACGTPASVRKFSPTSLVRELRARETSTITCIAIYTSWGERPMLLQVEELATELEGGWKPYVVGTFSTDVDKMKFKIEEENVPV